MNHRLSTMARRAALVCVLAVGAMPAAHAGLFDDDEARKAILDIRQRIDQNNEQIRARHAESMEQINLLKRTVFELNTQLEQMRIEMAKLRGTDEQLARDVSELQRRQKDITQGVDERMRKIEPQKVSVDGKEFLADPEEKRQYDEAIAVLRKGDFAGASAGLTAFMRRYPASGYTDSALFWLGNAQYGLRDYKEAINSFRTMARNAPDHARAPEALLSIANCQIELKDSKTARRTIDELMKTYPKSEAAQAGRERLAALR